jgi:hypothetical protein
MSTNATTKLLQSVRRQFEQFQQRYASMPGLVWLLPGAGVSFADALEQCQLTAGLFPNGRAIGAARLVSRLDGDGQPIELFLALPTDKTVNGAFASLAKEAGDCISDAATAAGVPDSVLSEEKPTFRWLRVLFWFALEQPGFPGQEKWYLLNLIDESAGRYAQIRDAVRCSIYVLDWLASQALQSETRSDDDIESPPESANGVDRKVVHGVSLKDIAAILSEDDRDGIRATKRRWHNSRSPKLPAAVGKDRKDRRADLYALSAILEFVKKVEFLTNDHVSQLRRQLRGCLRRPIDS